jgi:hypothetical protein
MGEVVNLAAKAVAVSDDAAARASFLDEGMWMVHMLRSRDFRNLVCIDTQSDGGWASQYSNTASVLESASLGYRGELMIVCVPKGSVWEISLSDIPYKAAPATNWLDALAKRVNDQREAILVGR